MRSSDVVLTDALLQAKALQFASALGVNTPGATKTISLPPKVGFSASRSFTNPSRTVSLKRQKVPHFKTFLLSDLSFRISSTSLLSTTSSTVIEPGCSIAWLQTRHWRSVQIMATRRIRLRSLFYSDAMRQVCAFSVIRKLVTFAKISFFRL